MNIIPISLPILPPSLKTFSRLAALPAILSVLIFTPLQGQHDEWQPTGAGTFDWTNGDNWIGASFGVPDGIDVDARLNRDISGDKVIELNDAITLGHLTLGDTTSSWFSQTLAAGVGGSLTFDVSTGNASLTKVAGGAGDVISSGITLNDNLELANESSQFTAAATLTLSGNISGSGGLLRSGSGMIILSGDNSHTGNNVFSAGTTRFGHASALGSTTGATTINSGASIQLNGFSTAENFTLNGGSLTNGGGTATVATVSGDITLTADSSVGGRLNSSGL